MTHLTINFRSASLNMPVMADVLLPECSRGCKTLYLLHDLGGDREWWLTQSRIVDYARDGQLAVVMPSGNNKFWMDNLEGKAYLRYIAEELPMQMVQWFGVSTSCRDRFVAGQGMGGFGAAWAIMQRPDCFAKGFALDATIPWEASGAVLTPQILEPVFGTDIESGMDKCRAAFETGPSTGRVFLEQSTGRDAWTERDEFLRKVFRGILAEGGAPWQ